MYFRPKYKYFLSVIGIFKNESAAMAEWINHYLNQGVDHFYLIDNGSIDESVNIIEKHINQGVITLKLDDKKWSQIELYNKYFLPLKDESEWLIICDLDEFIYGRKGFRTISEYLSTKSRKTGMIRIPWKMFGSSGIQSQPKSIISSFTRRNHYDGRQHPTMNDSNSGLNKSIVRSRYLKKVGIHFCEVKNCRTEDATGMLVSKDDENHIPINEELLEKSFLHLNHYALQSREWFFQVKCTRGAADGKEHEHVRNQEYFNIYDAHSNEIEDKELASLSRIIQ